MLAVDKKVLKAQFSRNSLEIHSKLVGLYLENLNAIATQAAIVADLGFGAVKEMGFHKEMDKTVHTPGSFTFGYFYYFMAISGLVTSVLALSQSTICVVFGHTMFLYGENHEVSLLAVHKMRTHQLESGFWGAVCAFCLIMQGCIFTWGMVPMDLGLIITVVYMCGMYMIYTEGRRTIASFRPETSLQDLGLSSETQLWTKIATFFGLAGETDEGAEEMEVTPEELGLLDSTGEVLTKDRLRGRVNKVRMRGYLWTKNLMTDHISEVFHRTYAVLENGALDFYRRREDYIDNLNPVNRRSYRMRDYELITNPKKIARFNAPPSVLGFAGVRALVTGTHELSTSDFMNATFSTEHALSRLRLTLAPKSSSELHTVDAVQLMVEDDVTYKQWVVKFSEVISIYDKIRTLDDTALTRRNVNDVESSLHFAHSKRSKMDFDISCS